MRETNETISLMKRRKKGFFGILFSRIGFIALLMLLQIALLLVLYFWINDYFRWFTGVEWIFSIGVTIYLLSTPMDPSAKLTWLFFILSFPIPATIMLWFTKNDVGHRRIKNRVDQLISETSDALPQSPGILDDERVRKSGLTELSRYINNSGCFPVYRNTSVRYFPEGQKYYDALTRELKKAEKYIYMEYFIVDEGYMWGSIMKILSEKASQGVDVRLMYDGMCEISNVTSDYSRRLCGIGIKSKPFSPIRPFISTYYNYRDHRKILVIDGKTAFNGGINLADEYINKKDRFGHWKDAAVMLRGEAVQSFTLMFLQMWNLDEKSPSWDQALVSTTPEKAEGFVMPYSDSPLDGEKVGENVYIDILYRAEKYVHIMTPYLILDNELQTAIEYASKRGIDVSIILPGIPDKLPAFALARSHYKRLTGSGVNIYEYTPGFIHSKVFVSDDKKAVVGTINLDYRSLYHHFECATYMLETDCIDSIEADFSETLKSCRRITPETIKKEKLSYKLLGGVMKLIAPLM